MDPLAALRDEIREFVRERDWEPFHDPKNLAMCLASEAGELLSELRWVAGQDADSHCRDAAHRQGVVDEMADVTLALLMLADRIDVDLVSAVRSKLTVIRKKYPVTTEVSEEGS